MTFPPLRSLDATRQQPARAADDVRRSRGGARRGTAGCWSTTGWSPSPAPAAAARRGSRSTARPMQPIAHPGGVWWVELAPVRTRNCVAATIAAGARACARSAAGRSSTRWRSSYVDPDALLVLDNCEQVLDGDRPTCSSRCCRRAGPRVLATSREPLGVPGEVAWRVPSLERTAATALFMERASQARPGFLARRGELRSRSCPDLPSGSTGSRWPRARRRPCPR